MLFSLSSFPPLRLVDFLRYSIRWHVRSHTKERLNGQSLMNSFSNHYWNIAYRKSSLKEVAMLEGHFFPAYLSSALDLCLGSLIATSYTLPCLYPTKDLPDVLNRHSENRLLA
ncbi:hypothetical protein BrnapMp053 (mitochondrion) [Brassica napus]|uniref:ORF112 n=9 Tax=Brassiceae TaxID=981071 RepID=Q6YSN9_BRANA|nr:orf112 [Brassica oleracea]YP_004927786.1 orf112 [Brassica juncea]YP_004927883.1 orf112 [Brassica rapa subsp. oleifera]YP_009907494.1 hypothetical protein [Brassica rapa]YP_717150.1 hypothetical protein BrnapMp053 [Brassica napus]AGY62769.1 orf112c [Eruca vesicaria subsp. sativa]AHY20368.1 hypothetical protein [Brassica juncea var. tumida]AIC83274.1 orf112 [Brassica oleracea var. botrytis]AOW69054.1 orf112 [Brassica oleracea var. capitata]AEH43456.1 orf112 [Brassica rapa subsp. oleifera]